LRENEVQSLLQQAAFSTQEQSALYQLSGGHPFLLQVLAKRTLENGAVESSFESMKHDETLQNFFIIDYNSLQAEDKSLMRRCAMGEVPAITSGTSETAAKQTLMSLGLLFEQDGRLQLRSPLFKFWLATLKPEPPVVGAANISAGPNDLRRGDRLGSYEILHEIGRGGMGVVYCGRDMHLQRLAAIKVLNSELVHDETQRARLLAEARDISQLQHPNIALIYAV
jgi:hypothetical protein